MLYDSYHGSPSRPFTKFDLGMCGMTSGLKDSKDTIFFTSRPEVAMKYSKPNGFIGRFQLQLDNPLVMEDEDRDKVIGKTISHARECGHDGLILRGSVHSALSPGMKSDIFIIFDPVRAIFESVELDNMRK